MSKKMIISIVVCVMIFGISGFCVAKSGALDPYKEQKNTTYIQWSERKETSFVEPLTLVTSQALTTSIHNAHHEYYKILLEYVNRLGICNSSVNDGMKGMRGVTYAKLIDFDNDGIDELYLQMFDKGNSGDNMANPILTEEVWGIVNGEVKKVYSEEHSSQDQHISSGAIRTICKKNDISYLVKSSAYSTGVGDFSAATLWNSTYSKYSNGEFNTVLILAVSIINYEGFTEYGGKTVYKAESIENEIKSEIDCKIFELEADAYHYSSKSLHDMLKSFDVKDDGIITGGAYQIMSWTVNDVSGLIEHLYPSRHNILKGAQI